VFLVARCPTISLTYRSLAYLESAAFQQHLVQPQARGQVELQLRMAHAGVPLTAALVQATPGLAGGKPVGLHRTNRTALQVAAMALLSPVALCTVWLHLPPPRHLP
jgi:hypothetical protein